MCHLYNESFPSFTAKVEPLEDEGFFIKSEHGYECLLCEKLIYGTRDLEEHRQEDFHKQQLMYV